MKSTFCLPIKAKKDARSQRQATAGSPSDGMELEEDPSAVQLSPRDSGQPILATNFSTNGNGRPPLISRVMMRLCVNSPLGTSEQTYTRNVMILQAKASKVDGVIANHFTAVGSQHL